jgi:hypothetical protein
VPTLPTQIPLVVDGQPEQLPLHQGFFESEHEATVKLAKIQNIRTRPTIREFLDMRGMLRSLQNMSRGIVL